MAMSILLDIFSNLMPMWKQTVVNLELPFRLHHPGAMLEQLNICFLPMLMSTLLVATMRPSKKLPRKDYADGIRKAVEYAIHVQQKRDVPPLSRLSGTKG